MEFKEKDSVELAITLDGEMLKDRPIKVIERPAVCYLSGSCVPPSPLPCTHMPTHLRANVPVACMVHTHLHPRRTRSIVHADLL